MTEPRTIEGVPEGEERANVLHKVAEAALFAVGSIEDDPFPRWRLSEIRKVRSKTKPYSNTVGGTVTPEEMDQALGLCGDLAPTPHERIEYGAENGIEASEHPNHAFGEFPITLRPLIGDELPRPPEDDD